MVYPGYIYARYMRDVDALFGFPAEERKTKQSSDNARNEHKPTRSPSSTPPSHDSGSHKSSTHNEHKPTPPTHYTTRYFGFPVLHGPMPIPHPTTSSPIITHPKTHDNGSTNSSNDKHESSPPRHLYVNPPIRRPYVNPPRHLYVNPPIKLRIGHPEHHDHTHGSGSTNTGSGSTSNGSTNNKHKPMPLPIPHPTPAPHPKYPLPQPISTPLPIIKHPKTHDNGSTNSSGSHKNGSGSTNTGSGSTSNGSTNNKHKPMPLPIPHPTPAPHPKYPLPQPIPPFHHIVTPFHHITPPTLHIITSSPILKHPKTHGSDSTNSSGSHKSSGSGSTTTHKSSTNTGSGSTSTTTHKSSTNSSGSTNNEYEPTPLPQPTPTIHQTNTTPITPIVHKPEQHTNTTPITPIVHKPEQHTNTQQQITPVINLSQMNSQSTNTQQTTKKQTSYTIQNLLSAIQIGNLTQAEKILNNLSNNGQISQSKANMANTVIEGLTKLRMQNQPISNVLRNLTNSFQQLYQKYTRTGKMPDNLIELANLINSTTSLLPEYSALVSPNVKAEISRLAALQRGGMGTVPGVLYQATEEQRPIPNIIVQ